MAPLNFSPSRQTHLFQKQARFPPVVARSQKEHFFTKLSDFDIIVRKARSKELHSFGTKSSRFGYMPQAKKEATTGPGQYDVVKSEQSIYHASSKYSIGVGRGNMNTIFVDEIKREA